MSRGIALIGRFATDWIRYSNYILKEDSKGDIYIVPAEDATFTMYNPFDVAEDLLLDLIGIGEEALKFERQSGEENEVRLNNLILVFAKKYGLLGLISASVYNHNIIGESTVFLMENNLIAKEKVMEGDQYINKFLPFIKEGDIIFYEHKHGIGIVKREDSPKFYGKRPIVLDLVFSRFYAEKIKWITGFAKMIVTHFNQLLTYRNSSMYLTENVTIMAGKFQAQKIGFIINQLDKTTIAWQFDSLKTAIETIYAFAVTDETILLNRCSHCEKVFIANSNREKYCNPLCRNSANVKKSRDKKSKQSKE